MHIHGLKDAFANCFFKPLSRVKQIFSGPTQPKLHSFKRPEVKDPSLSLFLDLCAKLPAEQKPLLPYLLINYLINNAPEPFAQLSIQEASNEITQKDLTTSCFISAYANAMIFFGESRAKKTLSKLNAIGLTDFGLPLPSGKFWRLKTATIFGGDYTRELNTQPKEAESLIKQRFQNHEVAYIQAFWRRLEKGIQVIRDTAANDHEAIEKYKAYLQNFNYDFNANTIGAFKQDIQANAEKVNFQTSYVYFVGLTYPFCVKEKISKHVFLHIFLLEQFLDQDHRVRYRLYQSWIDQASLRDDFKKRGYGEGAKGCLDQQAMENFLVNLDALCCDHGEFPPRLHNTTPCFGYDNKDPLSLLVFKENKLSGLSLRYASTPIDPDASVKNLLDVVSKDQALAQTLSFKPELISKELSNDSDFQPQNACQRP